jgi:hypothetical protein
VSNSLAIAAVTATLRNLLTTSFSADADLADTTVTALPADKARTTASNQINLFLYQATLNAAWRNQDMPGRVLKGETGRPPIALDLHYLLTVYGRNDDEVFGQEVLGKAIGVLNDNAILGVDDIQGALANNDLYAQVERIRVTPQTLSVDDMSRLWTIFGAQYRLSAVYQASVVLIDDRGPTRTPLPVLRRGDDDRGPAAQSTLLPPFPALSSISIPNDQPSARLADELVLMGHHLDGQSLTVTFSSPRLTAPNQVGPLPADNPEWVSVQIPDDPPRWPCGMYEVSVSIQKAGQPDRTTNALPLLLAPRITIAPDPAPRDANGSVTLTISCRPEVRLEQRTALLLGDREVLAGPRAPTTDRLTFVVTSAPVGDSWVRLRVDGVDSLLVDRTKTPPVFDPTQKVTIT